MKASTLIGILFGFAAIFGAFIWEGGTLDALIMLPAMLIVFGGTLAAGLAGSSFNDMARIPKLFWLAVNPPKYELDKIVKQIIEYSYIARRQGILAIDDKIPEMKHPFMQKLFQICIDGSDPETLNLIVNSEIANISHRHNKNIGLFMKMGGYSPTMGIIGTVMGLISTLAAAGSDPNILIHHIASAFIATMWGILMANVFWLPIGDKLKAMHNEEIQLINIMFEGVYSVQLGETPMVIKQKMIGAFPLKTQREIFDAFMKYQPPKDKQSTFTETPVIIIDDRNENPEK